MRWVIAALFLLGAVWLSAPAEAQPGRTGGLATGKSKFETDISKAEEALIASIDKAIKAASGNKAMMEKLTYERELFVSQRIVPTAVSTTAYIQKRTQAIAALEAAY